MGRRMHPRRVIDATSLLVLAGSAPARMYSDPVPLDELLQGAMSEIEDYGRIQAASASVANTVEVVGPAALDLAHLFAELLFKSVDSRLVHASLLSVTSET